MKRKQQFEKCIVIDDDDEEINASPAKRPRLSTDELVTDDLYDKDAFQLKQEKQHAAKNFVDLTFDAIHDEDDTMLSKYEENNFFNFFCKLAKYFLLSRY